MIFCGQCNKLKYKREKAVLNKTDKYQHDKYAHTITCLHARMTYNMHARMHVRYTCLHARTIHILALHARTIHMLVCTYTQHTNNTHTLETYTNTHANAQNSTTTAHTHTPVPVV